MHVQVLQSALIQACIECNDLGKARQLYHTMRAQGQAPTLKAFNTLINAYGRAMRLGDTVSLVKDLVTMEIKPDVRTFAAILGHASALMSPSWHLRCTGNLLAISSHRLGSGVSVIVMSMGNDMT